jgi:hypothetical protein
MTSKEKGNGSRKVRWNEAEIHNVLDHLVELILEDPSLDANSLLRGKAQEGLTADRKRTSNAVGISEYHKVFLSKWKDKIASLVRIEPKEVAVQVEQPIEIALEKASTDLLARTVFRRQQDEHQNLLKEVAELKQLLKKQEVPLLIQLKPETPPQPPEPPRVRKVKVLVAGVLGSQQRFIEEKLVAYSKFAEFRWHYSGNANAGNPNVEGCDYAIINCRFDRHMWEHHCVNTLGKRRVIKISGGVSSVVEGISELLDRVKIQRLREEIAQGGQK